MKIFSNSCDFYYPWEQVTAANWQKYPNEMSTHVVAVDVLRRELDPTSQILTSERLITCKQSIPSWLLYMVGGKDVSYVREVSTVDLNTKTLTLRSVNLTLSNLLKVYETVTYKPDATNPFKTVFNQEAQITAYATIQRICNKIEDWSVQRFGENAKKGKAGFESVLKIFTEQLDRSEQIVDEISGKVVQTYDELKVEIVDPAVDKILTEAEQVKKSILSEYYDVIKRAFKRDQ